MTIRPPAVAGTFYPAEPRALRGLIHSYLAEGKSAASAPKAIIAPHAGYVYSGPVAGSVYALLAPYRESITRVVLAGPSHFVAFAGVASSSVEAFASPLGHVPLDRATLDHLVNRELIAIRDEAHRREHSLETHLPFLQICLEAFSVVPLVVGDATPEEVAAVLDAAWGGPETLVVISSDLSHYHDYRTAQRLDRATATAIENLDAEALESDMACGCLPIQGLLLVARQKGLHARTLDLRNSGDTAGPRNEVVGYGAFSFQ